ncbi:MAG: helix-turn-helix domain-containing protein [Prevotella sp.]|nr:helix-turn-helix domain-containing protein [Prevotella sp.]
MIRTLSLFIVSMLAAGLQAQQFCRLMLPHREQLSSERVLAMTQDSDGCLWYATEGGGLCRDDGRTMEIWQNDGNNPHLLGSNNIASIAQADSMMIIGTYHGAYKLNRNLFTIARLEEVDDNRVDDILVTSNGEVILTANRKIYHYDASLCLLHVYPSRWKGNDVYVAHLFEDNSSRIWATQWQGGLLCLHGDEFREMPWPLSSQPTDIADGQTADDLWIGTVGQGIVCYHPSDGTVDMQPASGAAICVDLQPSADGKRLWMVTMDGLLLFDSKNQLRSIPTEGLLPEGPLVLHTLSLDLKGRLLVSGSEPGSFVIATQPAEPWYDGILHDGDVAWEYRERQGLLSHRQGETLPVLAPRQLLPTIAPRTEGGIWTTDGQQLYACTADTLMPVATLQQRPVAMTDDGNGHLWYSTGNNVHRLAIATHDDQILLEQTDVSGLAVTPDGTLWLATIYGKLYRYANGNLMLDDYASNEYGDAVSHLALDGRSRLLLVSDKYVRRYDPVRHTLAQQGIENSDTYSVELCETQPLGRWSQHLAPDTRIVERLPRWLTSWWMISLYVLVLIALVVLLIYNIVLRRQRKRFIQLLDSYASSDAVARQAIADVVTPTAAQVEDNKMDEVSEDITADASMPLSPFLSEAIAAFMPHLDDEKYSVEQLSRDLCMSRMTFYRKIQSATGQKPTEFMRTIRLRRAAELLRETTMSIAEISYATGFSSPSYFSRSFRSMYGVSPTQFVSK